MTDDAPTNWQVEGGDKIDLNVNGIIERVGCDQVCFFQVQLKPIDIYANSHRKFN